jgi:hypothetical protein
MAFLPALAAAAAPAAAGTVASTAGAAALAKGAALASTSSLASGIAAGSALGAGASMAAMPALSYAGANLAAPALGGLKAAAANPATWAAANKASGLGSIASQGANLTPKMINASQTVSSQLANQAPQVSNLAETIRGANTAARGPANMSYAPGAQGISPNAAALNPAGSPIQPGESFLSNLGNLIQNPSMEGLKSYVKEHPAASAGIAYSAYNAMQPDRKPPEASKGMIRPYKFERGPRKEAYETSPLTDTSERLYFSDTFTPLEPYEAPGPEYEEKRAASGGITSAYAVGGPVEQMSANNAIGGNEMYPQSQYQTPMYSNPMAQRPMPTNVIPQGLDAAVDPYRGEQRMAEGGEAKTEGGYKYSFDPKTQTFTQLSVPKVVEQGGRGGQGQGYTRYTGDRPLDPNKDDYYYVPGSMAGQGYFMARGLSEAPANTGPKTAGGIAPPVGGTPPLTPAAPMTPPAPAAAPINVPAYQSPEQRLGLTDFYSMMDRELGKMGGYAAGGGVSDLGGYSDGGRLLRGPGDGVSDSIPAVIGKRQPARLADGEFVIPARIVSELGNGSTEAGARKLYAMMERIQKTRKKSIGKKRVAVNSKADKHLPA